MLIGLLLGAIALLLCLIASVAYGAADISLDTVFAALTNFDGSANHLIILTARLPRSLVAILVGAALAVAGAIMQGITRNPLADPAILGIEAGASLAVVATTFLFGSSSVNTYIGFPFIGAGLAAIAVYWLASLGRERSLQL